MGSEMCIRDSQGRDYRFKTRKRQIAADRSNQAKKRKASSGSTCDAGTERELLVEDDSKASARGDRLLSGLQVTGLISLM